MPATSTRQRLKSIQHRLGVEPDGILGPATLSRIEDLLDRQRLPVADTVTHSLVVSSPGIEQLIGYEIGSESYYNRYLKKPVWPGGHSGVTLGIGYDLGYTSRTQIEKDWAARVSDNELEVLLRRSGVNGAAARTALRGTSHIRIELTAAKKVFYTSTLPIYAAKALKAYPGIERLPADAQAALLSLVYNRGTRMSGASRREMKRIKPLVKAGDLAGIAEQLRAMKRLWDIDKLPGLHKRRDQEALLLENARSVYPAEELVYV